MSSLNNKLREEIAVKLTAKAMQVEGARIAAEIEKLNRVFWSKAEAKADAIVPRHYWAQAVGTPIFNRESSVQPRVYDSEDESWSYGCAILRNRDRQTLDLVKSIMRDPQMAPLHRWLKESRYSYAQVLTLQHSSSIPDPGHLDQVECPETIAALAALDKACNQLVFAGLDFHNKVSGVLFSCRSVKQLQELLPEAARLVPPKPVDRSSSLMPVETAQAIQRMLVAGVPPVEATP